MEKQEQTTNQTSAAAADLNGAHVAPPAQHGPSAALEAATGPEFQALIAMAAAKDPQRIAALQETASKVGADRVRLAELREQRHLAEQTEGSLRRALEEEQKRLSKIQSEQYKLEPEYSLGKRNIIRELQKVAWEGVLPLPPRAESQTFRHEQLALLGVPGHAMAVFVEHGYQPSIIILLLPSHNEPIRISGETLYNQLDVSRLQDGWEFLDMAAELGLKLATASKESNRFYIEKLEQLVCGSGREQVKEVLRQLRETLDPEITGTIRNACGNTGIHEYNFCAKAQGRARLYRAQAIAALPYFAPALMADSLEKNLPNGLETLPGFAAQIDGGASPQALLAQFYGCSRSLIKRLAHGPDVQMQLSGNCRMHNEAFLRNIAQIDINLVPMFTGDSSRGEDILMKMLTYATELERQHGANVCCGEILNALPTKWHALLRENSSIRLSDVKRAVGELRDFLRALFDAAVAPDLHDLNMPHMDGCFAVCAPEIFRAIFPHPSPIKIMDIVQDWHDISWRWPKEIRDIHWPPLTPPLTAPVEYGGCRLGFLTSEEEIIAEGAEQQHCVGGYGDRCLSGNTHILSVRDDSGKIISTAELHREDDNSLTLIQHRAKRNGTPPEHAVKSITWFMDQLSSGGIKVDFKNFDQELQHLQAAPHTDDRSERLREAQFARFQRWLPERYGKMTRKGFLFMTGIFFLLNNPSSFEYADERHTPDSPLYKAMRNVAQLLRGRPEE